MRFTFQANDSRRVAVEAESEREARHLAMAQLHGLPLRIGKVIVSQPAGGGLVLVSIEG